MVRWCASTEANAITDTVDQIPKFRLYKTTRDYMQRELDPRLATIYAVIDQQVVGAALWRLPASLVRQETLFQFLYRKGTEYKTAIEDWLFPSWWTIQARWAEIVTAEEKCAEKFLGCRKVDDMWYLKLLAVHPQFQRKGVGAALVDWGLNQAQERGEKAYLEASEMGEGFYLKKGFKVVGELVVGDGDNSLVNSCMLWDADTARK